MKYVKIDQHLLETIFWENKMDRMFDIFLSNDLRHFTNARQMKLKIRVSM